VDDRSYTVTLSGFMEDGGFVDHLRDYQLLNKEPYPWS
jgi:hypothetical protein